MVTTLIALLSFVGGIVLSAVIRRLSTRGADSPTVGVPNDVPEANDDTVKLIYEHSKEGSTEQLRDSEQLDTKAATVFAAATVAIGLAARLPPDESPKLSPIARAVTDNQKILDTSAVDACVYLAAVFWALVVLATFLNLRTKSYARPVQANDLWPDYAEYKQENLRRVLVRDAARAYRINRGSLKKKANFFNVALLMIGVEGLFIVGALVMTR